MNRKIKLGIIVFIVALSFASCGPEEPLEYKYEYEAKLDGIGGLGVCCMVPGNTCAIKGTYYVPPYFRTYVENDRLSDYFRYEKWQADFPELVSMPEVVSYILEKNPKGMFLQDKAFVILKDKNSLPVTDNVLFAFKYGSPECDKVFGDIYTD